MYKCLIFLIVCSSVLYAEGPLLQEKDIHTIMRGIFRQHVDKKEMTGSVFREAAKNFIEQADPDHVYLLEQEVNPFLHLTDEQAAVLTERYRAGDYSYFMNMNDVVQSAFKREQSLRESRRNDFPLWVEEAATSTAQNATDSWTDWARTPAELSQRFESYFKAFAIAWIHRFGKARALKSKKELIGKFLDELKYHEDLYLYLTPEGSALPKDEVQNLLSLHILKALASALDSHTKIYNPNEALSMRIRLEKGFEGVGLVLERGDEGLKVSQVMEGSPAAKTGLIHAGDELTDVNGVSLKGLELQEGVRLIRESPSDHVAITLLRQDDLGKKYVKVHLKKAEIAVDADRVDVKSFKFGNGIIGVLKFDEFYQGQGDVSTVDDIRKAIDKLDQQNLRGLILDLRENGGGFLTQAVKVVGLFISNGIVVISKYSSGDEKVYRDLDGKADYKGPLVVLVSKMTASAAEIVAQALQDYGVALIVGDEHTYGKGTIQSQTVTDDKENAASYFKVTVGKYYTVSGKTPQLQGVLSDIVVPGPLSNFKVGEEYLEGALAQDSIPPSYKDDLKDVSPSLKSWYLKYYMPTLQPREREWKSLVPQLKKNSAYRMAHNLEYLNFLNEQKEAFTPGHDLQLNEAIHIVQDMITLESKKSREENNPSR